MSSNVSSRIIHTCSNLSNNQCLCSKVSDRYSLVQFESDYNFNPNIQHLQINSNQNFATEKRMRVPKDFFEKKHWANNQLVCGLDEVGRGCLAGPLVVAAVILFPNNRLKLLKDSKVLTKEELQSVYPRILANCWYGFGILNNHEIDKFNIYQATLIAMRQAIMNLFVTCPKLPSTILVDALPLTLNDTCYKDIEIHSFYRCESLSRTVAAASILAKVKRDYLMTLLDVAIPGYEFAKHKGYGTKLHLDTLQQNGSSILHRKTFLKNFNNTQEEENEGQKSIFCGNN